jgi:DNA invertase Pin-like site-specific DNA recombinase
MHPKITTTTEPCALLLRESSRAAADEALRTQEFVVRPVAQERGYRVVKIYADDGYSGELPPDERPGVRDCLADAARGLFRVVLMSDLDRAFRGEPEQYFALKIALAEAGCRLEFASGDPEDDGSELGALLRGIQLYLPSIKKRSTVKKLRAGIERAWAEGRTWASVAPFGYRYVPGPRGTGRWEKDDDEAAWVTRIYERAAAGWTLGQIGRWLQAQGAPSRRGGRWWPATVKALLTNPKYCGRFGARRFQATKAQRPYKARPTTRQTGQEGRARRQVLTSSKLRPRAEWGPEQVIEKLAIVDADTWERAQAQLKRNAAVRPPRSPHPSPLYGLVVCGRPHGQRGEQRMHLHRRKVGPAAYRCHWQEAPGQTICPGYANAAKLEEAVAARLRALATDPDSVLAGVKASRQQWDRWSRDWQRRAALSAAEVKKAQVLLDNLKLAWLGGSGEIGSVEEYNRLKAVAEARYKEALAAHSALEEEHEERLAQEREPATSALLEGAAFAPEFDWPTLRAAILRTLEAVALEEWDGLDAAERLRRTRTVVEKIVIDEDGAWLWLAGGTVEQLRMDADRRLS